jgi:hypothetical protein
MHLIIRHEFDRGVREDTQERRGVALKEPQNTRVFVYLPPSAEGTTPRAWPEVASSATASMGPSVRDAPAYFWYSGLEA